MPKKLAQNEFVEIYSKVPRLCVDLVIKNEKGILLTLRNSEPFDNMWHLPGGTLYKDETIAEAAKRIAKSETGLDISVVKCLGYFEYLKEKREVEMHSVSIAMESEILGGYLVHDKNSQDINFFKEIPENVAEPQKEFLEKLNK